MAADQIPGDATRNFLAAVRGEGSVACSFADAVMAVAIVEEAFASARDGCGGAPSAERPVCRLRRQQVRHLRQGLLERAEDRLGGHGDHQVFDEPEILDAEAPAVVPATLLVLPRRRGRGRARGPDRA